MSNQKFRARAINASKQIPIYSADEVPDLSECSTTPDVSTVFIGMEKEEQYEHHLLAKIFEGRVIPIPDVVKLEGVDYLEYDKMYPRVHVMPKQLIRLDPFGMEQDNVTNYDADEEDELWINTQAKDLDITLHKFESIIDKLESMSQYAIVTLEEAKVSLDEDKELLTCIYDYWQNKRFNFQQPLVPTIPSDCGSNTKNANPYVAFRRPFLNMQTRRNKKNDEKLYVKVIKIKRDLGRLLKLLDLVKHRENTKKDLQDISLRIFEKRFKAEDWSGKWIDQVTNDNVFTPELSAEVTPTFFEDDGPFTFRRRKDCCYLAPKVCDVERQSPLKTVKGLYGRAKRLILHRSHDDMYDDSAVGFHKYENVHEPESVVQENGFQILEPKVPFVCYFSEEDDVEEEQFNFYRFNENKLLLCSKSDKVKFESLLEEESLNDDGLLNSIESADYSQSLHDSTDDQTMFTCDDFFASIEISNLINSNTAALHNTNYDFIQKDTVGNSTFFMS